jgi:hypothetical protein
MLHHVRRPLGLTMLFAAAVLLVAMLAGPAMADPVKVSGSWTQLAVDPEITEALAGAGVAIQPVDPAEVQPVKRKGDCSFRYTFRVTGGMVDPGTLAGTIRHSGGLRFVRLADGAMLEATDFRIDTVEQKLFGLVGDMYVPLLDLDLSAITVGGKAPTVTVAGIVASLTPEAANALNATFGEGTVAAGLRIGTAYTKLRLPYYGHTEVVFDADVLQALGEAGLSCMPVAPGLVKPIVAGAPYGEELWGFTFAYHFPITKRDLSGKVQWIRHAGGLNCINFGACRWVTMKDFKIDPVNAYLSGRVRGMRASLFDLDLSRVVPSEQGPYTVLAPVELTLTAGAAKLLNHKLGVQLFQAGLPVGEAKVVVRL